ncbi:MAG: pyridoxal-phosphate dependent enzyme [Clostridia bacterium]
MFYNDLYCIRCGQPAGPEFHFDDCPHCRKEGVSANYSARITLPHIIDGHFPLHTKEPGIWKYRSLYAIAPHVTPVSLQEGNTPLLKLENLSRKLGLAKLYAKDETRNPTWSHKDRLTTIGVTKAREIGAKCIVVSSTGNQGISAAAYAAKAGIPCVAFTGTTSPAAMKTLMRAYGAMVFELPTSHERTTLVEKCVCDLGWFPLTGFGESGHKGANAYAIDGYKSMAAELIDQLGEVPDKIIFPVAGGDSMTGTWKGFVELKDMGLIDKLPQMIAAEPLGPLEKTVRLSSKIPLAVEERPTVAFAVASPDGTYQALKAIYDSHGDAVSAQDEEIMLAQAALAQNEGMFVEPSSALSLAVATKMANEKRIRPDEIVVIVLTSSGLKEYQSASERLGATLEIKPTLQDLRAGLSAEYGFSI